jgi:death-on-curing protein
MKVVTLKKEHIICIHSVLSDEAKRSNEPISPAGIKDEGLLDSSISVQHTGWGGSYKYTCPVHNVSALTYSITTNHAFGNGNKRTALVAMLAHLRWNDFTLKARVKEEHLFCLLVCCASHRLTDFIKCKNDADIMDLKRKIEDGKRNEERYVNTYVNKNMDEEVRLIKKWLDNNITQPEQEKKMTLKELKELLLMHNFDFDYEFKSERFYVYQITKFLGVKTRSSKGWFQLRIRNKDAKLSKNDLSFVRFHLHLDEKHGVSSDQFYNIGHGEYGDIIAKYRNVLSELAKY